MAVGQTDAVVHLPDPSPCRKGLWGCHQPYNYNSVQELTNGWALAVAVVTSSASHTVPCNYAKRSETWSPPVVTPHLTNYRLYSGVFDRVCQTRRKMRSHLRVRLSSPSLTLVGCATMMTWRPFSFAKQRSSLIKRPAQGIDRTMRIRTG